ncbi:MAG: hypothetical protein ACK5O2_11455 [Microthrixaceae bacterium]
MPVEAESDSPPTTDDTGSPNPPSPISDEEKGGPAGEEPHDHDQEPLTLEEVRETYGADENPNVIVEDNGDGTFQVTLLNPIEPDARPADPDKVGPPDPIPGGGEAYVATPRGEG